MLKGPRENTMNIILCYIAVSYFLCVREVHYYKWYEFSELGCFQLAECFVAEL